jgi:hypothetical protein
MTSAEVVKQPELMRQDFCQSRAICASTSVAQATNTQSSDALATWGASHLDNCGLSGRGPPRRRVVARGARLFRSFAGTASEEMTKKGTKSIEQTTCREEMGHPQQNCHLAGDSMRIKL